MRSWARSMPARLRRRCRSRIAQRLRFPLRHIRIERHPASMTRRCRRKTLPMPHHCHSRPATSSVKHIAREKPLHRFCACANGLSTWWAFRHGFAAHSSMRSWPLSARRACAAFSTAWVSRASTRCDRSLMMPSRAPHQSNRQSAPASPLPCGTLSAHVCCR